MSERVHLLTDRNVALLSRWLEALASCGGIWEIRATPQRRKRTVDQNSKLHAMCTDVARQVEWAGGYLEPEEWKRIFVAAIYGQRVVPGLDGEFVVLNKRTSRMKVAECAEVIERIYAFGAEKNVVWSDPTEGIHDNARDVRAEAAQENTQVVPGDRAAQSGGW